LAGKIIIDTLATESSFLTMNVGSNSIATMNANGIYSSSGTKMVGADGTIGVATIANTAITGVLNTAQIADGAITADKIADGTVIAADIADGNVTAAKLASTLDLTGKTVSLNSPTISGNTAFDTSTLYINASDNAVLVGKTSIDYTTVGFEATPNSIFQANAMTGDGVKPLLMARKSDDGEFIQFRRDSTQVGSIGAASGGIYFGSGTSSTERMRIDSSGNVGIGTSSPTSDLHINRNGIDVGIRINCADTTGTAKIQFGTQSDVVSTGIQFNASDNSLAFRGFDNTERMRIASDGSVGINTTSPTSGIPLTLYQTNTNDALHLSGGNDPGDGYVQVRGDNEGGIRIRGGGSNNGGAIELSGGARDTDPGIIKFSTGTSSVGTERMLIDGSGVIWFNGSTDASGAWRTSKGGAAGGSIVRFNKPNSGATNVILNYYGATYVGGMNMDNTGTQFITSSDYRLKENNVNITDGITRVKQLNPYRFNFIAEPDRTVDGFYAHEVQDIVPEAITGTKDAVDDEGNPVYQGIDQAKLVPLLTAALQEAITKIEDLETRLQALEG